MSYFHEFSLHFVNLKPFVTLISTVCVHTSKAHNILHNDRNAPAVHVHVVTKQMGTVLVNYILGWNNQKKKKGPFNKERYITLLFYIPKPILKVTRIIEKMKIPFGK